MTAFGIDPSLLKTIEHRLMTVRPLIPANVKLIAITKKQPIAAIRAAYALGIRDFGESRIQEAIPKQQQLADLDDITWHFIGHLQGNKASKAIQHFQWIHSVDSLKLAQRMNQLIAKQQSEKLEKSEKSETENNSDSSLSSPKLCLQVKLEADPNKSGWSVPTLLQDLKTLAQLSHLDIVGLMSIPPLGRTDAEIYSIFTQTKELAEQIQTYALPNIRMEHLSMGMSGDYALAIKAGATMIRLGRTLFGERT